MTEEPGLVRFAIVGTGGVSREVAHDLALTGNARATAIVSRDEDRGRAFAERFAVDRVHVDFATCLADPDVDVVYIATPHATHLAYAEAALLAGKHVLVEKPIALNGDEVRRLATLATDGGLFLMEAMWMLFNETIRAVLARVEAGAIGEVRSLQASIGMRMPPDMQAAWTARRGDSSLLNQGIYPITLAHTLLGKPVSVTARNALLPDGVDVGGHVTLDFPGGRFAQLAYSMVEPIAQSATINGTEGWITIPPPFWFPEQAVLQPAGHPLPPSEEIRYPREGWGYTPMLRAVADAVHRGDTEAVQHTLAQTAEVYDLVDRARLSR